MFDEKRILNVMQCIQNKNINQILICNPFDIFYLTRIFIEPGERFYGLYINIDGTKKLFMNQIFRIDVESLGDIKMVIYSDDDDPIKIFHNEIKKYSDSKILIDKNFPARFLIKMLTENIFDVEKIFISDILEHVRLIKTQEEINFMRDCSRLNDSVMELLVKNIKQNQSELALVEILRRIKSDLGIDKFSFEPIIAFGKNAAEPHHISNQTKLKPGDCIVIDIGFIKNNYCSDMTRTFFYKYASESDKKIYDIVLKANLAAIKKINPGTNFSEIDLVARNYIKQSGYGENFIHSTGHSIGLECHEFGTVGFRNQEIIKENMIFSVEPGIYIKNQLGIRIEDLILVTKNGCELLNRFNKNISVID